MTDTNLPPADTIRESVTAVDDADGPEGDASWPSSSGPGRVDASGGRVHANHPSESRIPESIDDCFICLACRDDIDVQPLDQPVRRQPGVGAIITGAGPLCIGYVLIVPEAHYGDLATAIRLNRDFADFVERALVEYEELFGEYVFWEHGSAALSMRTSGCVEHAHLNVIPKLPLTPPPDARSVPNWSAVGQATSPYLLLGNGDAIHIGADSGVTQHYRREWAHLVGDADHWDYALAGNPDFQLTTAERYAA